MRKWAAQLDLHMNSNLFDRLASHVANPSVTISLNTHRTHPDNLQDAINLKNLVKEASERLRNLEGGVPVMAKLHAIADNVDVNLNLDSLHLFVSENTSEVLRSPLKVSNPAVKISDRFALKPIIKLLNRTEVYYIMVLSQSGVKLYETVNDTVTNEVTTGGFPFPESPYYLENNTRRSDTKREDNLVREYFNQIDKALVELHKDSGRDTVVICTESNYSRLMQVADRPGIYIGYSPINYNDVAPHTIAKQAWPLVQERVDAERAAAVDEVGKAVGSGLVYTDLSHIFRAVTEGRGDLLVCNETFRQPARIKDELTIELIDSPKESETADDIISEIALRVIERKGRVVFVDPSMVNGLGDVALKLRY